MIYEGRDFTISEASYEKARSEAVYIIASGIEWPRNDEERDEVRWRVEGRATPEIFDCASISHIWDETQGKWRERPRARSPKLRYWSISGEESWEEELWEE